MMTEKRLTPTPKQLLQLSRIEAFNPRLLLSEAQAQALLNNFKQEQKRTNEIEKPPIRGFVCSIKR